MKIFKLFNKRNKKEEGFDKYSFKIYLKNFFLNGGEKITYYFINNNNIIENKTIMLKNEEFLYGTSLLEQISSKEDIFNIISSKEMIFLTKEGAHKALEEKKEKTKNEKINSFFE